MAPFATTYIAPWHERWTQATVPVDMDALGLRAGIRRLAAYDGPAIVNGAVPARKAYADLLATARLIRRGHTVLVSDATWEPGSRTLDRTAKTLDVQPPPKHRPLVTKGLRTAIDSPRTHYAVWSRAELERFPREWGVDPARVHFIPFSATSRDTEALSPGGGGIFAGGNSLRDYRQLIRAAPRIEMRMRIATTLPTADHPGVEIGPLSPEEFDAQSMKADIVVVPLIDGTMRSAGQQTYLNAMMRGQATVITRAPGVEDYVVDGETALVVENDADELTRVLNELVADPDRRRALGAAGREAVLERFTLAHLFDRTLDLAESLPR